MIVAKIQVTDNIAHTVYRKVITAGIIGAQVEFEYADDIWNGLRKTVVFRGSVTKDVVTDENIVTIPQEVAEKPLSPLSVGVYGVDVDGNLAIPTIWADLGAIRDAANPSSDTTTDPSLPVWAQIQGMIGNLEDLDTDAKNNLVAAVNEAMTKGGVVSSVNGKTGAVVLTAGDVHAMPDNTVIPTVPKKVSAFENDAGYLTEHQDISGKVDKVAGKGLSTHDYDNAAKAKVDAIPDEPKYTDTVYDDTEVIENINQLKGDFDEVVTKTPVSRNLANPAEYIPNKIMTSAGALADSSSAFVMGAIQVVSGEKIYLTLPRTINCFDANGSNIQSLYYVANPKTWSDEYTVPDGVASIVITGYNSRLPYMVNRGTELLPYEAYSDDVEYEVKPAVLPEIPVEKVPDINVDKIIGFREDSILPFVYEPEYTMSKGYMSPNGSITETENHKHTSKINVNAGDVISIVSPKKASLRFVCAFDENDNAKYSSGSMTQIYSYTVPDGITSVVLTIENQYEGYYKVLIATNRNVSGAKYVSKTELPNNSIAVVKNKIAPKLHDKVSGVVNSETGMKINACCCQNKTIMFRGNISSISDIVIGLGHNGAREIFYKIDGTKVRLYTSASGNPVVEIEHGLAISGYICVTINANDLTAKITLATMSGVFTHETNAWIKNPAEVFVETDSGSVLTDCELIFSPNDICKSIWLFGDSYMSYADNRVLYWLKNLGAKNFCINALPGEASDRAMTDLMYMLEYSTPSKIIWNMGMNDGDKNSAVNPNWETCFNLLKAICGEKGIELILYTVPSVPTVDNEYKNAVIHDSGYRYIDGASAVGASASGVWYDGMLSSDGVHPSKTGAIAIAQEMILTVPELLLN